MLDIGLEIKILRERLKVSSKELAERVGLSQSQMSRLEKGQRRIDTGVLHRISDALGVDPAFFFRQAATAPAGEAAPAGVEVAAAALQVERSAEPAHPGAEAAAPGALVLPRIRHEHLGQLIRSERRKKHLSVDELATRVGRTKAYMAALEEGRHALDAALAERISRALKLSPSFFVEAQQEAIAVLEQQVARLDQALAEFHRGEAWKSEEEIRRRGIPLYGDLGSGLRLAFDAGDEPIGEPEDFLHLPGLEGRRCFAVTISGDAMESGGSPSFREGDIAVFGGDVTRSRDFVLARLADGSLHFRQVFFEPHGAVRLQPLNLDHAALSLPRQEIGAMWRLVLHIARL